MSCTKEKVICYQTKNTLTPLEEIAFATNYFQDLPEKPKVALLRRLCARTLNCFVIFGQMHLPPSTDETVQKINGDNNSFLERIIAKTNVYFIWFHRETNDYLFWGSTEDSIYAAIMLVQTQIDTVMQDVGKELPRLSYQQTVLMGKIEKMNETFRFAAFLKWNKDNQLLFRPDDFLQEFQKECNKQRQNYAKKVKRIQEMRAKGMWNENSSADELCAFAHDYDETKCSREKQQLDEINNDICRYLMMNELSFEIYIEDDDE
jgi:hypothetical protein